MLDAFELAGKSPHLSGKVFNIAYGKEHTVKEVVLATKKIMKGNIPLKWGVLEKRPWDSARSNYDISKARNELGWQPKNSLEEGLKKTVRWFKHNSNLYEQ